MELPPYKARPEFGMYRGDVPLCYLPSKFIWKVHYQTLEISIDQQPFLKAAKKYGVPLEEFVRCAVAASEYMLKTRRYAELADHYHPSNFPNVSTVAVAAGRLMSILNGHSFRSNEDGISEEDAIMYFLGAEPIPDEKLLRML